MNHTCEGMDHTCKRAGTRVHACETLRRSKVGDLNYSAVCVDKNVITLDVSVNNLVVMLATSHSYY